MDHRRVSRSGLTLMELVATVTIIGMFAGLSVILLPQSMGALGSRVDARRLFRDLNQTRSRAIATGDDHRISFQKSGKKITGYLVERLGTNGQVSPVDVVYMFNEDVDVATTNGESVTFTFEGTSSGATNIALSSPQSQWNVSIATQTGFVSYTQVTTGEGRPTPIN